MPKKTFSLPQSILDRLEKYDTETPEWKRFNKSQICAEALDRKLTEEGF